MNTGLQVVAGRIIAIFVVVLMISGQADAGATGIHPAPIVVRGKEIIRATRQPISAYRLFRTNTKGYAEQIPFQIDELTTIGDFIMETQLIGNKVFSDGIFDPQDELVFMGEDVGEAVAPRSWSVRKPDVLFEIKSQQGNAAIKPGAVFLGVYFRSPPELSPRRYVNLSTTSAEILTSRYRYQFDRLNYLVVRGVGMLADGSKSERPLISASTFFVNLDFKYFLDIKIDHRDIRSELEGFKLGPVRAIVRINFYYRFLNLNFELGMFTEISFFSNAVFLPAVIYNPLDGEKTFERGSGFYYGFALVDNPASLNVQTNMPSYAPESLLDVFKAKSTALPLYWLSATAKDYMIYLEIKPSMQMRERGNVPALYREAVPGNQLASRESKKPTPLGKSPVNIALNFDLRRFAEGEQNMGFNLYFENRSDASLVEKFRNLGLWDLILTHVPQK